MTAPAEKSKTIDIWLVFVIVLMVIAIGGGLYMTGKSLSLNIDELNLRTTSRLQRLETEVFALRKQVQDVDLLLRRAEKERHEAKAPPPPPPAKTGE
jgi:hypothetical protein